MRKAREDEAAHIIIDGERRILEDGDDYRELMQKHNLKGIDVIAPIEVLVCLHLKGKSRPKQQDAAELLFEVTDKYRRKG